MINILLPIAGGGGLANEMGSHYPTPLVEIKGRSMIECVIENLKEINDLCRFIVLLRTEDCRKFHLDNTVSLLVPVESVVLKLDNTTQGALCSSLLAISHIDNETPLVIANSDQIFNEGVLASAIELIKKSGAAAGCPYFSSVHPRWSYVQMDEGAIIEAAEKNPISKNAIAGIYYFSSGALFVKAAKRAILNRRETDDVFYISSVLNELILDGRRVIGVPVNNDDYYSFFTPQRVEDFQKSRYSEKNAK